MASIVAGVLGTMRAAPAAAPAPDGPASDERPHATPEQAYALSLPVLGAWLEDDFAHAWIVTANTLEAAAAALDHAALDDDRYRHWVGVFEGVVAVADAVAARDQDAALRAFAPLLAAYPGPYADVAVDPSLSRTPDADASARVDALEAAVSGDDRVAVRTAAGDVAEALAEVVLAASLDVSEDPERVLERALPALHAVDAVHDAVLTGHASEAAAAAAQVRVAFDTFHPWYRTVTG